MINKDFLAAAEADIMHYIEIYKDFLEEATAEEAAEATKNIEELYKQLKEIKKGGF